MKKSISILLVSLATFSLSNTASAHCQVPCGIYADDNVFVGLEKDVETIQKAIKMINDESTTKQQLVRWVTNKESHAQNIQDVASAYFLAQRVKVPEDGKTDDKYVKKIALLHKMTVFAMKCKQTTDSANAEKLAKALADFKTLYNAK